MWWWGEVELVDVGWCGGGGDGGVCVCVCGGVVVGGRVVVVVALLLLDGKFATVCQGLWYWVLDQPQGSQVLNVAKCAGDLDTQSNTYQVSTKENFLTRFLTHENEYTLHTYK